MVSKAEQQAPMPGIKEAILLMAVAIAVALFLWLAVEWNKMQPEPQNQYSQASRAIEILTPAPSAPGNQDNFRR